MNETDKEKLDEDFESWFNEVVNGRSGSPSIRAIAEWWLDKIDHLIVEERRRLMVEIVNWLALPQDGKEIK